MKKIKNLLLGIFFICMFMYMNSTISYAQDIKNINGEKILSSYAQDIKNENVEKVLNSYFNNEWSSIKDGTPYSSSDIVINNDFKTYYDKYIQTRVEWYNSLNKKLQRYQLYVNVTNVTIYNNTYVVSVEYGHDLVFLDSADILQEMRNEKHIIILENENNTLKVRNDFKVDDLKDMGYSEDILTLPSLEKIEKKFTQSKIEFISNCLKNVNSEVLKYKTQLQNTVKNNSAKPSVGLLSTYTRSQAVTYALAHYADAEHFPGQDCTNFISTCLNAGGITQSTLWKPYTNAWVSVQLWYDYFVSASGRGSEVIWSTDLGDIVQFGTDSINWHHSTIITYSRPTTGEIWLSSHSNARKNYDYSNYYASYHSSRFIHIY